MAPDWMEELIGRLSVLGIPPEVTEGLTITQMQGIQITLANWLPGISKHPSVEDL